MAVRRVDDSNGRDGKGATGAGIVASPLRFDDVDDDAEGTPGSALPAGSRGTVRMRVWRGDASGGQFRDYQLSANEGEVVLDVVHRIQAEQAPDLAVRWNCKAGKCGSCSAEINGRPSLMCMTRMSTLPPGETVTISPMRGFPIIRDLVADVSYNYEVAKRIPAFKPGPREADGTYRMQQVDIDRVQEFHKCIECFLCQNVCHVIRDHETNKRRFAGPRFFVRLAALEMHPLDTNDRRALIREKHAIGLCNITKCCTEVCPEHIHITDNAIIPLKERVVDVRYDPIAWLGRKMRRKPKPKTADEAFKDTPAYRASVASPTVTTPAGASPATAAAATATATAATIATAGGTSTPVREDAAPETTPSHPGPGAATLAMPADLDVVEEAPAEWARPEEADGHAAGGSGAAGLRVVAAPAGADEDEDEDDADEDEAEGEGEGDESPAVLERNTYLDRKVPPLGKATDVQPSVIAPPVSTEAPAEAAAPPKSARARATRSSATSTAAATAGATAAAATAAAAKRTTSKRAAKGAPPPAPAPAPPAAAATKRAATKKAAPAPPAPAPVAKRTAKKAAPAPAAAPAARAAKSSPPAPAPAAAAKAAKAPARAAAPAKATKKAAPPPPAPAPVAKASKATASKATKAAPPKAAKKAAPPPAPPAPAPKAAKASKAKKGAPPAKRGTKR
jgi:succinate dehydrogenase / fumarate reductase iron-sulfur subunit